MTTQTLQMSNVYPLYSQNISTTFYLPNPPIPSLLSYTHRLAHNIPHQPCLYFPPPSHSHPSYRPTLCLTLSLIPSMSTDLTISPLISVPATPTHIPSTISLLSYPMSTSTLLRTPTVTYLPSPPSHSVSTPTLLHPSPVNCLHTLALCVYPYPPAHTHGQPSPHPPTPPTQTLFCLMIVTHLPNHPVSLSLPLPSHTSSDCHPSLHPSKPSETDRAVGGWLQAWCRSSLCVAVVITRSLA